MAKAKIYRVSDGCWACYGPDCYLHGYGATPREAYRNWLRRKTKMEIVRVKAFPPRFEKVTINVDEVFEESHRVVMAEVLRIGKKVLPVILALVAGFLIGRLYGAS